MAYHRAQIYNKKPDECRWPVDLLGKNIRDCNFNLQPLEERKMLFGKVNIVKLPAGTRLYHGTLIPFKQKLWFLNSHPKDTSKGGVWFTSTKEHQQNVNSSFVLEYRTTRDMYGIFERNLWDISMGTTGNQYASYFMNLLRYIKDYKIEFYAGCNECELFILNNSIKTVLQTNPIVLASPKEDANPYKFIN